MNHSRLYRHAAVSAALLLTASCADGPTAATAPLDGARAGEAAAHGKHVASGDVVKRTKKLHSDLSASATITPAGGVLVIEEAGLLLYFPPGAVSQTTTVSATALKGKYVVYDFQPHGATFNTEIYVAQSVAGTELGKQHAQQQPEDVWGAYLSRGVEDIRGDGTANFVEIFTAFYTGKGDDQFVVFTTSHFSQYAMASGMRPPLPGGL